MENQVGPRLKQIPAGDNRERLVCPECRYIAYENPKLVSGVVVGRNHEVLLCRRAIMPQRGLWTLPAGFMEVNETPEEGALREAYEEARVQLELTGLLAVYSIPGISQVQTLFRARLKAPGFAPGPESLEVAFFPLDSIPWDEIAFPTVRWALHRYIEVGDADPLVTVTNPPGQTAALPELEEG